MLTPSSRPGWATQEVLGQSGQLTETMSLSQVKSERGREREKKGSEGRREKARQMTMGTSEK